MLRVWRLRHRNQRRTSGRRGLNFSIKSEACFDVSINSVFVTGSMNGKRIGQSQFLFCQLEHRGEKGSERKRTSDGESPGVGLRPDA